MTLIQCATKGSPLAEFKAALATSERDEVAETVELLSKPVSDVGPGLASKYLTTLGDWHKKAGTLEDAARCYRAALGQEHYAHAVSGLVQVLSYLGRNEQAVETIRANLQLVPRHNALSCQFMLAATRADQPHLCEEIFKLAGSKTTYDVRQLLTKAKCDQVQGNPVGARLRAQEAMELLGPDTKDAEDVRKEFIPLDDVVEFQYQNRHFRFIWPELANEERRRNMSRFGELEILEYLRDRHPRHEVIVDIGCHIGNHSRYFYDFMEVKHIYGFDAARGAGLYYCRNVPEAKFFNVALGEAGETILLYGDILNHRFGQSSVAVGNQLVRPEARHVSTRALDEFELGKITLIKMDVEGWELKVLKGAARTLNRYRPVIVLEVLQGKDEEYRAFFAEQLPNYEVTRVFGDTTWKKYDLLLEPKR